MRRLPWGAVLRPDRRMALTAIGVALCAAFAVISFAVPAGLQTRTVSPNGPLAVQDAVIARLDGASFDARDVGIANVTWVLLATVDGERVGALSGPLAPEVPAGHARPGGAHALKTAYEIEGAKLAGGEVVHDVRVGVDWLVLNATDFRALVPGFASGNVTYGLAPALAPGDAARLHASGLSVSRAPGVQPFFEGSVLEVSFDLYLVVVFSSVLVILFTYEFVRSEIRSKRPQIGLWRAVGMRAPDVLALLLARTAVLSIGGFAVGLCIALGAFGLAAALGAGALLVAGIHVGAWALLALVFVFASLLGAAWPAWTAARGLVRRQMEADA